MTEAGHTVIGVDLHDAEVIADLGTAEGRHRAVEEILALSGGVLDGVAAVAGIGPNMGDAAAVVSIALLREPDLIERIRREPATRSLCVHCNKCMPTIFSGTRCVLT